MVACVAGLAYPIDVASTERIIEQPPRAAVRLLAMSHLADARHAARRLRSGDPERLHDFRVSLRRLRTLVRVFASHFDDSVRKKHRRRLRDLGRDSSGRRDAQARLALLDALPGTASWPGAAARVAERLAEQVRQSDEVPTSLVKDFRALDRRLRRRLRSYRESIDLDELSEPVAFGSVAVAACTKLAEKLIAALGRIESSADSQAMHRARLAAKRLRYTLEPFKSMSPPIGDAVLALSRLQDVLGDMRDSACVRDIAIAELEQSDQLLATEFDALKSALHEHAADSYTELQTLWLDGNSVWFFQRLLQALASISPVAFARSGLQPDAGAAENP